MPSLTKATLQEISASPDATPQGDAIPLQFNPQSLRLELSNRVEGGDTRGRQNRQHIGNASTTLSFDLHFDTADLGTTDEPVSVRTQTAMIERFVLPKDNTSQVPPKCRFHWDELVLDGIIDGVSIDFELFAANGTPLRAKMSVSIKEQDAKYELPDPAPAADRGDSNTPAGAPGTGPGSSGGGPTDSSAQALDGESAADFAVRMGLDPSAWRGIAGQLGGGSSLSLQAGLSIDFSASLSASVGIGVSAGVGAGAGVSLETSFGLDVGASLGVGASASSSVAGGFALSAAGGLGAALETVAIVKTESAAASARRSFGSAVPSSSSRAPAVNVAGAAAAMGAASISPASTAGLSASSNVPPPAIAPKPALPDQRRTPLQMSGIGSRTQQAAAPSAPSPPRADPRSTSFGMGVPLRPRVGSAADLRADIAAGRAPLRPSGSITDAGSAPDPSAPPWTQLPPAAGGSGGRGQARRTRKSSSGCGCK